MSNELTIWGDVFSEHLDAVSREVGYAIGVDQLLADPGDIPPGQRQAVREFEAALYEHLYEHICDRIEQLRRALSETSRWFTRRALSYLHLSNYADVEQAGRALIPVPVGSSGRQIEAFWHKHLPELEIAGVDPMLVGDVMAREDKFVIVASHALSRIERNAVLSTADKQAAYREIISDAATMDSAAALGRKWLNGQIQIPRDILTMGDGTRLVTFVCASDEQFLTLDKLTRHVTGDYGNVEPILLEWMKGKR